MLTYWEDYAHVQKIPDDHMGDIHFFYMMSNEDGSFSIEKNVVNKADIVLTDYQVGQRIEELIQDLPFQDISCSTILTRFKVKVARDTRRGLANTRLNDAYFYSGSEKIDGPFHVIKYKDRHAVLTHPNYKSYGFRTNYSPEASLSNTEDI